MRITKYIFCLLSILNVGCESESVDINSPVSTKVFTIQGDFHDIISDDFNLFDATLTEGILTLEVGYSGGCEEHEFTIVWPDAIIAIYPPEFSIYVTHDGNGDMCEAYLKETLEIDISDNPLQINAATLEVSKLGVVNASNSGQAFYPND